MIDPAASATTGLGDLLRQIALRRAPIDRSPLLAMGDIIRPATEHASLPLSPELLVAWRALIGEESWSWQRQALEAVRRGDSLVLAAPPPLGMATLLLLAADLSLLAGQAAELRSTLLLAPTEAAFRDLAETVASLDALLGGVLPHLALGHDSPLPRQPVPLVLATPATLHQRLLRHHDRAWRWLWPSLRRIVIPAADEAPGAPLGHLRWLLRRVARLLPARRSPQLLVSMQMAPDLLASAARLLGQPVRTAVAGTGVGVTTWAVWRGDVNIAADTVDLAAAIRSAGLSVALYGRDDLERALLERAGTLAGLPAAGWVRAVEQAVIVPWSGETWLIPALAAAGYRLVIALADPGLPANFLRSTSVALAPESPLPWPQAAENPYVVAAHLRCAAEERPLDEDEVLDWGCEAMVERLEQRGRLAWLPGEDNRWQPVARDDDPYAELSPAGIGGAPVAVFDHEGGLLGQVEPFELERRLYPGAQLPGVSVASWSEGEPISTIPGGTLWTTAVRRMQVRVRDELAARQLADTRAPSLLRWGKVVVQEEVTGRAEWDGDGPPEITPVEPPLVVQWSAPACWIEVPEGAAATPEAGLLWAAMIPLIVRCRPRDIVPCGANGAIYLVEAQPGGRGLAQAIYETAEQSLQLAFAAAGEARETALWGAAATAALSWLTPLLEGSPATTKPAKPAPQVSPPAGIEHPPYLTRAQSRSAPPAPRDQTSVEPRRADQPASAPDPPPQPPPAQAGPPGAGIAADEQAQASPPVQSRRRSRPTARSAQTQPSRVAARQVRRPAEKARLRQGKRYPPAEAPLEGSTHQAPAAEQAPAARDRAEPDDRALPPEQEGTTPPAEQQPLAFEPSIGRPPEPDESRRQPPARRWQERASHERAPPGRRPRQGSTPDRTTRGRPGQRPTERGTAARRPADPAGRTEQPRPGERRPPPASAQPPMDQPQPPRPEPEEPKVDASALLERARRMREQREAQARSRGRAGRQKTNGAHVPSADPAESRFVAGQRVACLPYGEGVVRHVRFSGGRELLDIDFAEHGELQIDPAVSLVRLISTSDDAEEEDEG